MKERPAVHRNARSARPRACVIGSGLGGLAAAVRLSREYDVQVLERLDQPGGRASVFRQDGFVFDAGPTIITAPFLLEELWEMCGRKLSDDVELRPMRPFYRIRFDDGTHFDCSDDPVAMRTEVQRVAPNDVAGYERFLSHSERIFKVAFEELGHVPFSSWWDMFSRVGDLATLRADQSVFTAVSRFVRNPKLRMALSFHPLLVGGNPLSTTSVYSLIFHLERKWGVHFAMGGTGSIVRGLARLIESQGGRLRCNAEVDQITTRGKRVNGVRLRSGEHINADVVVSNADPIDTYRELLPPADRPRMRKRMSMSLFVWYFGTKRRYDDVLHHTILMGPRYRELLRDIFDRQVLADDFSLYLHRPTATDPSLAPAGCDAFYVLSPVPNLAAEIDWTEQAEPYRIKISRFLEATLLPGLENHLATSRVMTPDDFRSRYRSPLGAGFSLQPTLLQSAYFRPHNQSPKYENLFLVGAGTHPGAGIPGVLSSARVLDSVVPGLAEAFA